jgi:hypothetical protein
MNCKHIAKILPLYAGGDLGDKDERIVAAHLRTCESCRPLAEGYRRSQEILHSYEAPEFGSAFFDEIRSAVLAAHARTTTQLTPFQRARNFIKEILPDAQLFSPRAVGFASLLLAVMLGLNLFLPQSRRQADESANAGKAFLDTVAANSPQPREQPHSTHSSSSPEAKLTSAPLATGETLKVERPLTATVRTEAKRRTTPRLAARRESTAERQPKLFEAEALLPGEESYLDAISKLDKVIRERHDVISATLRAEYERNLTDVDRAIASTRKAALKHRDNPEMTDFVFAAYRGKVVLLSEVVKQAQSATSDF